MKAALPLVLGPVVVDVINAEEGFLSFSATSAPVSAVSTVNFVPHGVPAVGVSPVHFGFPGG
jgi:hypothetical protein